MVQGNRMNIRVLAPVKAITQYVEREEKREAFRQDTLRAWEVVQVTGVAVTAGGLAARFAHAPGVVAL